MLIDTTAWRGVAERWPPPRTATALAAMSPEEYRRVMAMPIPDLGGLLAALAPADISALCAAIGGNAHPDAPIAHSLLWSAVGQRPEIVTPEVFSEWLRSIGRAHGAVIARWQHEGSDEALSALYHQFVNRVPAGVALAELLALLGPPTDQESLAGEFSEWATYVGTEQSLQLWADAAGRFCADKFT